ncbi:hypothetical protein ASD68_03610 [Rhodanobacter sp. Root627]|uniref:hypothetical protein n=1 Tax=Rhodanobacter sp. Root627 TaxID=1736572 RepID=UPI0006FEE6A6|nr:hypothetical protein [Rhodanobacter sp. Root627]KRA35499.1 hypothetical protein ASD68_03610 [Rhodanobacter sp. Root627]
MTSLDRVVDAGEEQRTKPSIAAVGETDRRGSTVAKRTVKKNLAPTTAPPAVLKPEQIAFLGEHAAHHKATAAKAFVQVLCWPTLPDAWPRLTRSCAALVAVRTEMFSSGAVPGARSWVQGVAPQLSLPFSRDAGAEESTLATLITRLPARFVASVVEPDHERNVVPELALYRRSLSGCLSAYEAFLKDAHESARGVLIAASRKGDQGKNLLGAFKDTRDRLDDDSSLANFELRLWSEHVLPLPLEIANLAAAAISRYLEAPKQANPIFDAVASKLVNPPTCLESRKRR